MPTNTKPMTKLEQFVSCFDFPSCTRTEVFFAGSSLSSQSLSPAPTLRIKERLLANTDSANPIPLSLTLNIMRRSMERRPIIPNRNIIRALPLKPDLQIMIINQQPAKPLQQRLALQLRDIIDMADMSS